MKPTSNAIDAEARHHFRFFRRAAPSRQSRLHQLLGLLLAIPVALIGCGDSGYLDSSTAKVATPKAEKFLDTWLFYAKDSPDNYTFQSNYSVTRNPAVDPNLTVLGYLVNDIDSWNGGSQHGNGEAESNANISAIEDSLEPSEGTACTTVMRQPEVVRCKYDVAPERLEQPHEVLVRRFEESSTVMILWVTGLGDLEYISGEFEFLSISEAEEKSWEPPLIR